MRVQPPKNSKEYPETFEDYSEFKKYILNHRVIYEEGDEIGVIEFFQDLGKKEGKNIALLIFETLWPLEYGHHIRRIFKDLV